MFELVPTYNGWLCESDPGEPGLDSPRWSVNEIEARIASELLRGLDVLEIGTGLGVSTKEIAKRAKTVHTVDIDSWVEETIVPSLPENVKFYKDILDVPLGLDAAFIDGKHTYEQCKKDIEDARKIVKRSGIFVFHDLKISGVSKAIHESGMTLSIIDTYAGMALAWNKE